jgi:hypothetical protein
MCPLLRQTRSFVFPELTLLRPSYARQVGAVNRASRKRAPQDTNPLPGTNGISTVPVNLSSTELFPDNDNLDYILFDLYSFQLQSSLKSRACGSVVERPLCMVSWFAEGPGFDHLPVHFFRIFFALLHALLLDFSAAVVSASVSTLSSSVVVILGLLLKECVNRSSESVHFLMYLHILSSREAYFVWKFFNGTISWHK